nr:ABC transporter ATP-binding protein [Frankia nepalensis]
MSAPTERTRDTASAAAAGQPVAVAEAPVAEPLVVEGVTVRFGALAALSDVSLRAEPGSIHAVIGPNGAGKSTLFNVISGVYRATSGRALLGETVLTGQRPHRVTALGVGRAFQNLAGSPYESVLDNIMVGRHHLMRTGFLGAGLRLPWARREERLHRARAREIAEFLDLGARLHVPVGILPYGDRKRVEVARALATEPRVLLLDEPVAGMNAVETARMTETIRDIRASLGITVLLVEHDMTMVMSLADRITVLDFGRVVADGTPAEVSRDPAVIRAYLGTGEEEQVAVGAAAVEVAAVEVAEAGVAEASAAEGDTAEGGPGAPGADADGAWTKAGSRTDHQDEGAVAASKGKERP